MSGLCTVIAGTACRAIVQCLPHAVVLLDETFRILLANRAASTLFRRPAATLRGVAITELVSHANLGLFLADFGERRMKVMELPLTGSRGAATVSLTAMRLTYWNGLQRSRRETGKRDLRLVVLQDITEKALLEQQVIEGEKHSAVGQLAAGILHEVSNPLASIGSNLSFVRGALPASIPPDVHEALDVSLEQLGELRQLLATLSTVPRRQPRYDIADVHAVIRRSVEFLARDARTRGVSIALRLAPLPMRCEIDAPLIKQVLLNVFKNAFEAMPDGGRITVRTSLRPPREHDVAAAVLEIEDTGTGVDDINLRRVFRPLFSTKPAGTGLGLSFCRQVVEEHGGWIRLARAAAGGTVVTISLPLEGVSGASA